MSSLRFSAYQNYILILTRNRAPESCKGSTRFLTDMKLVVVSTLTTQGHYMISPTEVTMQNFKSEFSPAFITGTTITVYTR